MSGASMLLVTALLLGAPASAARAAGREVTVYFGAQQEYARAVAKAFERATGIRMRYVRMSGGEILTRIHAERESPRASVWFGGPSDSFVEAAAEGLLEAFTPPGAAQLPPQYKDPAGRWHGIYVGYLGFVSDKESLRRAGIPPPTSWEDLLRPELTGRIMASNPGTSGTGFTLLATQVSLRGERDGLRYMSRLHAQLKQYTKAGPDAVTAVALGECAVAVGMMHDGIGLQLQGYTDLTVTAPAEGTGYEIGAVALIQGAPEREAAQELIRWLFTKAAQELPRTAGQYQFATLPGVAPPPEAAALKGTRLIRYDSTWAGLHRARLIEAWSDCLRGGCESGGIACTPDCAHGGGR